MLNAQVIYLKHKSKNPGDISGKHVHGFFFKELLASQNPKLADDLHQPHHPKPFSLSYLYQDKGLYWFRIASWQEEIARAVFSYFRFHEQISLNQCRFELIKTTTDRRESVWADRIDKKGFIQKAKQTKENVFWLIHRSPTAFKCGDAHLSLPVPELLLNSLYRQLPSDIKAELLATPRDLLNRIQLKSHDIRSVYNQRGYGSVASFDGKTQWQIHKKASAEEKAAIHTLFEFAFYAGIGVKTTQGMGLCRIHRPGG